METNEYLCGVAAHPSSPAHFSDVMAISGLPASLRESSHYREGEYVSLKVDGARISAEKVNDHEYLFRGEGWVVGELRALCEALSRALGENSISHKLEVYDQDDQLLQEFVFDPTA